MTAATKTDAAREMRRFYLVQRIKRSRVAEIPVEKRKGLQKISNPFGYGNLGDYELDYMGSAEFEWGAISEALKRFVKAGKGITLEQREHKGHALDFLWVEKEGDPFEDWCAWVDGKPYRGRYGEYARRPCEGKEPAWELRDRLDGKEEPEWGWCADIWWALDEIVMWSFSGDDHIVRMLESMQSGPKSRVRG